MIGYVTILMIVKWMPKSDIYDITVLPFCVLYLLNWLFVAGGKKGREDGTKLVNEADGPRPNPTEIPSPTEAPGETSIEHK